jgi:hypothetical protein
MWFGRPAYGRFVFMWLANWWDGVDLWLSQLAFPFQFAIVIAVLGPLCWGVAWGIDRIVDLVSGRVRRTRMTTEMMATTPEPMPVRADVPPGTPATIITSLDPGPQVEATAAAGHGAESAGS